MGIKRLYNYLTYAFEQQKIYESKELHGVTVGIDAMGWLYQAYFGYCEDSKDIYLAIIRNIEMKVKYLEKNKIKFYFIIDGKALDCKRNTRALRDLKRQKHLLKSKQMEKNNYDCGESSVYKKYSQKISLEIVYFFIDFLKTKEYQYIVAPYESDSQLYYLYAKKYIDYIVSEDSDIIAFGCNHVIKNFKKNGECLVLNERTVDNLKSSLKKKNQENLAKKQKCVKFFQLNTEQKIEICIACGCDYLDNIKGMGFGTIINYIEKDQSVRKFLSKYCYDIDDQDVQLYPEGIKNRKQYLKIFDFVRTAFQQQLIYDCKTRTLKTLSNKNKEIWKDQSEKNINELLSYIGDKKSFQNPQEFCQGNLKFDTMEKRSFFDFDYERAIRFINFKPKYQVFTLSNLCVKSYGFENFEDFTFKKSTNYSDQTSQYQENDNSPKNISNLSRKKLKVN